MANILLTNTGDSLGKRLARELVARGHTLTAAGAEGTLIICSEVSVQGAKDLVKSARKGKVSHIIFISRRGASPHAKSSRLVTAYEEELIVRQSSIPYTILRPAAIAGRWIRPARVDDLVKSVASAVDARPQNRTVELSGPGKLTLREVLGLGKNALQCGPR